MGRSVIGLGRGGTPGPMGPVAFVLDLHLQERDCTPAALRQPITGAALTLRGRKRPTLPGILPVGWLGGRAALAEKSGRWGASRDRQAKLPSGIRRERSDPSALTPPRPLTTVGPGGRGLAPGRDRLGRLALAGD